MYPLKQSTAITVPFFVHDVSGDAVTGLTNASFTKRISKNGAAFAAMTVVITEMENGWYSIPLSTTHSNTLGLLTIVFTNAGAKQVNLQFRVHARLPDDLAYPNVSGRGMDVDATGGVEITVNQDVNVAQWNGSAVAVPTVAGVPEVDLTHMEGVTQSVTDLKDFADAGYDPVANKVQGVVLVDTSTVNSDMRGTDSAATAAALATAQADLDTITDADGVILGAAGVDLIWDELLTGATHNVATSAGRRLRQLEAAFDLHVGTAQAGAARTITLDAGASAIDDFYAHQLVVIEEGTGAEQARIVWTYDGTTKVATVARPWSTNPDSTSIFVISPGAVHGETDHTIVDLGLAQAATANSITLAATASATNGLYDPGAVEIIEGTGTGQQRFIIGYDGTTKIAEIDKDWRINPDTTSVYQIVGQPLAMHVNEGFAQAGAAGTITLNSVADSVDDTYIGQLIFIKSGTGQDQARVITDYNGTTKVATVAPNWTTTPDATSGYVMLPGGINLADIYRISGDLTAADNLELDYDGTGYNKSNSTIGTCTANTDVRGTDNAALASVATETRLAELDAANLPTDVANVQADTDDIQARLPAGLLGGRIDANASALAGVAGSATNLERGAKALVLGAAVGTPTTTVIDTDLTETTNDHYKGRIVTFTTGNIAGQASDITAYNGTTKELTVTALTDAPAAGDEFVIS